MHRQIRDHLHKVVRTFDAHHTTILSKLASSQARQVESYQEWWQKFKTCLLQQATLHDQFAQHLEIAQQSYQENEQQIVSSMPDQPHSSHEEKIGRGT
jgi:hypothetical protein